MPSLATFIRQYWKPSPEQLAREDLQVGKEEVKRPLFIDGMSLHTENAEDQTEKPFQN